MIFNLFQTHKTATFRRARNHRAKIQSIKTLLVDLFFILLGVFMASFGLKGFLLPNSFIDGGATGISLLLSEWSGLPLSVLLVDVNIPFVIVGWQQIGRQFAIRTGLAISALSLVVLFVPFPEITHDKLLVAVFGGFFLGAGIGSAIRGGAVIDGTEVLAIAISRRYKISIGDFILVFNVLLFLVATYLLSVEAALYSALTYLAASKTVNFIVEGMEQYTGVIIISSKAYQLRDLLINKLGYGVTIYKGERGILENGKTVSQDILYTVITRMEVNKLVSEMRAIDEKVFVIMNSIHDTRGGMIRKRKL